MPLASLISSSPSSKILFLLGICILFDRDETVIISVGAKEAAKAKLAAKGTKGKVKPKKNPNRTTVIMTIGKAMTKMLFRFLYS